MELARVGESNVVFFPAFRPASSGGFRSIGAHGCFMSHLTLLKNCTDSNSVLLMEDDVQFSSDFIERSRLVEGLPEDWDIFYAGYDQLPGSKGRWTEIGLREVNGTTEFIGTHCYAVNGPAIPKLIQIYETFLSRDPGHPEGGPMPIDGAMNTARRLLHLRSFIAVPQLAHQRSSRNDIGKPKWFDNAPFLNIVAQRARSLKNSLKRLW